MLDRYSARACDLYHFLHVAYARAFRHPTTTIQRPGPGWPGPKYSVLRAAGTLVFRAGKKSKRNLAFGKQYFSHLWRGGKTPVFCMDYLSLLNRTRFAGQVNKVFPPVVPE